MYMCFVFDFIHEHWNATSRNSYVRSHSSDTGMAPYIWIATCGVHMAESLLVSRNFVSGICKLKPKERKTKKTFKNLKI